MNLNEFQILSRRTHNQLSKEDLLVNGFLGVIGELGEFQDSPTLDEMGDIMFYLSMMCDSMDISLSLADELPMSPSEYQLDYDIKWIADRVKKIKYHNHILTDKNRYDILSFIRSIYSYIYYYHSNHCEEVLIIEDSLIHNINKLEKRYPNGFNYQDSIERKDEN